MIIECDKPHGTVVKSDEHRSIRRAFYIEDPSRIVLSQASVDRKVGVRRSDWGADFDEDREVSADGRKEKGCRSGNDCDGPSEVNLMVGQCFGPVQNSGVKTPESASASTVDIATDDVNATVAQPFSTAAAPQAGLP